MFCAFVLVDVAIFIVVVVLAATAAEAAKQNVW